jgi:hypothetical protein
MNTEKLSSENETSNGILGAVSGSIPTKWAKTEEIETWIGGSVLENKGGRARLIVTHYCGDNKEDLIGQLETLIYGLKNGFDCFGS